MRRNRFFVLVGVILFVLLSGVPVLAAPISAHLTTRTIGDFPAPPRFEANLDAFITLEAHPGPFWWPNLQMFLPASNGYVITSFVGTFNGKPAEMILDDPTRPPWMVLLGPPGLNFFQLGYLLFKSEGDVWRINSDTAQVTDLIITGPPGFSHVATTTTVPELPSAGLTSTGLAVLLCLVSVRRRAH